MQDIVFIILLYCNRIPEFVASRYPRFQVQKSIENARKRVLDAVNRVLFSKTVCNKFITVQDVVSNMLLCCNRIPEFVASRYPRFRVQKSIENARKRVLDAVNRVLFSRTVSNKFITVQDIYPSRGLKKNNFFFMFLKIFNL